MSKSEMSAEEKKKKMKKAGEIVRKYFESAPSLDAHVEPGLPVGLKVSIHRVNGKTRRVDEIATGKFDSALRHWKFEGKESEIVTWLEKNFNKGGAKNQGGVDLGINSIDYLKYLRDTLMPTKNLVMDWKY